MTDPQSKYLQLSEPELFAELYQAAFGWGTAYEIASLDLIWKHASGSRPQFVCEIGSGTGRFCIPLVQQGIRLSGVESDPSMLRVLRRNQRLLPPEVAARLNILAVPFEQLEVTETCDAIIAMTDTASYFWPVVKFQSLLAKSRKMLNHGGVLILDVGLWGPGIRTIREESWMAITEEGFVKAQYVAEILEAIPNENEPLARLEKLSFEGELEGVKVRASRESILHAFTLSSICDLCEQADFLPQLCVIPGTREVVAADGNCERLMIAFS